VRPTTRLALLLPLLAAAPVPVASQGPAPARHILFVGNSYTYWNELPRMVRALADSAGHPEITIESITAPGVSLEDHWNEGPARSKIAAGGWEIVVLQQGPSSQPEGRRLLREYVSKFSQEIHRVGGRPALYMVWPSRERSGDFDGVRESYTAAATLVGGLLFPASEAWRAAWRRDSTLALYSGDNLHPSRLGSYLTALVMVAELLGQPPEGLVSGITIDGPAGYTLVVPEPVARLLKGAAAEAIRSLSPSFLISPITNSDSSR
jgi:hypothetical protein